MLFEDKARSQIRSWSWPSSHLCSAASASQFEWCALLRINAGTFSETLSAGLVYLQTRRWHSCRWCPPHHWCSCAQWLHWLEDGGFCDVQVVHVFMCRVRCNSSCITYFHVRNNLNKILETPYSAQNWKIELHRVGDVVVMDVRKGEFLSQSSAQSLKMQYWGHKFESCCAGSDTVDVESEWCGGATLHWHTQRVTKYCTSLMINDAQRRCSVYRTSLGTHRLLVSAEIDCEETLPNGSRAFVEIKTSGSMSTAQLRCNFRERKLIKYWIQSYVAGVPTVVVGYRSDDGVLTVCCSASHCSFLDLIIKNCNQFCLWLIVFLCI